MTTRPRRHPFRQTSEGLEKYCPGCERFRAVKFFSRRRRGVRTDGTLRAGDYLSRCKDCINKAVVKHDDVSGNVPVASVHWVFEEIVMRVGQRRAATAIETTADTLRAIVNRRSYSVQRRRVRKALIYLRYLRAEEVWEPPTVGRPLRIPDRCVGCKGELKSYTAGCYQCMDRKSKRKQRREGIVILTRAQCLGLWRLAQELPNDATFEIEGIDNYGSIMVSAKSESPWMPAPKRYRLPTRGGHEELDAVASPE